QSQYRHRRRSDAGRQNGRAAAARPTHCRRCRTTRGHRAAPAASRDPVPRLAAGAARRYGSRHRRMTEPLMILVAGPYRSGTNDDPVLIEANMRAMNQAALQLVRAGHLGITGDALALPLLELAGSQHMCDAIWDEIFHP